jgi:carbon storage regulator CsrA
MLVLSRKVNEVIELPELGVTFTILRVRGAAVQVGVIAPKECRIVRKELRSKERT